MEPNTGIPQPLPGIIAAASMPGLGGSAAPTLGLVTRTLLPSPVIRWIIPARIRHKDKNDVIFIRNQSIEIKEFVDDNLHDVIVKDDFGATIRAARVIGAPRKPTAVPEPLEQSGYHAIIKQEDESKITDEIATDLMDMEIATPQEIPPQILVMSLQSGLKDTLLFLFAFHDPSSQIRFLSYQHPLYSRGRDVERLGKHIAVDPRSRAMAVAAYSGSLTVYSLKPMAQLKAEVEGPEGLLSDRFLPISSERQIPVDGIIQKMEFMYPAKGDVNHVILLLVVSTQRDTRLRRFEWYDNTDLDTLEQRGDHLAGTRKQCPLLLIPFAVTTGFSLVYEDRIALYPKMLEDMVPTFAPTLAPSRVDPKEPGSSQGFPLWTGWARPTRRDDWASTNECLYLCREDGTVRFMEFTRATPTMTVTSQVGQININVDTAFAVLDNGVGGWTTEKISSDDILVAAGDMSHGSLIRFAARQDGEELQTISNWAPMIDFCLASVNTALHSSAVLAGPIHPGGRDRVFGCFGKGRNHGAVCELRSGIQARSSIIFELDKGITKSWILPDLSGSGTAIYILIAYSRDDPTVVLRVGHDGGEPEDIHEPEALYGIDIDSMTLAACSTITGIVIQITERSLQAFVPSQGPPLVRRLDETIKLAYVEGRSSAILMATASNRLYYGSLTIDQGALRFDVAEESGVAKPIYLTSEPSCVYLETINQKIYAFVGTASGQLHVFIAHCTVGLQLILTYDFQGDVAICDSVAVIYRETHAIGRSGVLILCGLRNGSLETFSFRPEESELGKSLQRCEKLTFGDTTVTVKPDTSSAFGSDYLSDRAIIVCGRDLCCVSMQLYQQKVLKVIVQSIWLTVDDEPALCQSSLSALSQSESWNINQSNNSRLMFCIDNTRLHGTELMSTLHPRAIVRHIPVPGTPSRIIYISRLNKLLVSFTTIRLKEPRQSNGHVTSAGKRLLYPALMFLDPNDSGQDKDATIDEELNSPRLITKVSSSLPYQTPRILGSSGMRVLGILEWTPSIGGSTYHLVVINALRVRKNGTKTGIIQLYVIADSGVDMVAIHLKQKFTFDAPVYSIAPFGASSLVCCSGNSLELKTLESTDSVGRWISHPRQPLRSPAMHISVREPFVYASTAQHSLSVFRVEGGSLTPMYSDEGARLSSSHVLLPDYSLVLASNKDNTVAGLWQPPTPQINNSTRTVFEASLSGSITKLCRGLVKPPWLSSVEGSSKSVVGSGMDGSFYQFEVVDEKKWRLLRFLQNIAERNSTVCPITRSATPKKHIEPSNQKLSYMHIDGDILLRLLDRGSPDTATLIESMLLQDTDPNLHHVDFESPQDRKARFLEIAAAALGTQDEGDLLDAVVDYLGFVLQSAL